MMSRKRAALLLTNNNVVSGVSKVRHSRSNLSSLYNLLLDRINTLTLVKQLSTAAATERTDFQNESYNGEFQHNPSNGGGGVVYQRQNPGHFQQHNPPSTNGYIGNPPPTETETGGVYHRQNHPNPSPVQFQQQQNPSSSNGYSSSELFQQQRPSESGVYHRENHNPGGHFQQNPNGGGYGEIPNGFQQNQNNGYRGGNPRELFQQNLNNHNGVYGGNPRELQSNSNGGTFNQNPNGYYGESTNRHVANGYYRESSSEQFQGRQNVYSRPSIGEFEQNPNANVSGNPGGFQQNPIGNVSGNTGGFQQNPNTWQGGTSDAYSQTTSDAALNNQSIGAAAETTQSPQGTIGELDSFLEEGKIKEAVEILGLLEKQGINVDLNRYFQLMEVCGKAVAVQQAKAIHDHLMRSMTHVGVNIQNKILEMYLKCSSMSEAWELFDKMPERNLTSWDTMIVGLTQNGLGEDAIDLFTQFKEAGLKPDGQMFFGIFSACSALCDITEGMLHFESMSKVYGITPSMDHYVGVVDMLGSTGYLDEALEFIENMPFEPSVDVWETLMNLCRIHGNLELGNYCGQMVEHFDPNRLTDQSKIGLVPVKDSDVAKEKEKKILSSQNLLEVRSRVHEYRAGDTSHPEKDKIYAQLKGLSAQMKEAGYVPETRFVLHDIDQEQKEEALLSHSERLAVSYGLISSSARSPIRIIKNLRVCGDCHNALKIISKLVGREIIARDAKRFHHFKDGKCSCNDYW